MQCWILDQITNRLSYFSPFLTENYSAITKTTAIQIQEVAKYRFLLEHTQCLHNAGFPTKDNIKLFQRNAQCWLGAVVCIFNFQVIANARFLPVRFWPANPLFFVSRKTKTKKCSATFTYYKLGRNMLHAICLETSAACLIDGFVQTCCSYCRGSAIRL